MIFIILSKGLTYTMLTSTHTYLKMAICLIFLPLPLESGCYRYVLFHCVWDVLVLEPRTLHIIEKYSTNWITSSVKILFLNIFYFLFVHTETMKLIHISLIFIKISVFFSSMCAQQFSIIISDSYTVNNKLNIYCSLISRQLFPYWEGQYPHPVILSSLQILITDRSFPLHICCQEFIGSWKRTRGKKWICPDMAAHSVVSGNAGQQIYQMAKMCFVYFLT